MTAPKDLPYRIAEREMIDEADGLRVQILSLGPGECVPWHYHNTVRDIFVGLEGTTVIETRAPRARHELAPGQHCTIPVLTAHEVTGLNGEPCRFVIVQGVGEHDFHLVG